MAQHTTRAPKRWMRWSGRRGRWSRGWWRRAMPRQGWARLAVRRLRVRWRAGVVADAGMATAEYAIATVAAVGFAGLLVVILRSDEVRELLMGIIRSALHV